ncbi:GDSL-type esterase/lipase family protein [Halomontanus rarus]|uniref:GDSL-type esterase/lipase family protein n=1 Tax=Halomontanus rarus TaxID=3034020 RepID=UPI001A992BA0
MIVHELSIVGLLLGVVGLLACANANHRRFDLGSGPVAAGYERLAPTMDYTSDRGYGWLGATEPTAVRRGGDEALDRELITADEPFWFTADVPEGNYRVTVVLGDRESATRTTVKAESRRLVLPRVRTDAGRFRTAQFTVNVRNPALPDGGRVDLNDRERDALHWDDQLTLEFSDERPGVCAIELERIDDATTVFLAGDSTVTDQPAFPWNSWGQMLTRFFGPAVAVANHAESGRTIRSFVAERRWEKVRSQLEAGDYLFVQFGHNDMKNGTPEETGYRDGLSTFVEAARERDATPVLLTPPHRRRFDGGAVVDTHRDYPDAVRRVAREKNVALIDLHAASKTLYEALGPEGSAAAFVDGTHHTDYGSDQLARCVVAGIRENDLELARFLRPEFGAYDPADPTPTPAEWLVPDVTPDPHLPT